MVKTWWKFKLMSPVIVFLAAMFLGPFLYMIWISFTDLSYSNPDRDGNLIGLENYSRAASNDPIFRGSLVRSSIFALLCVGSEVAFGLVVAQFIQAQRWARGFLASLFVLPVLIPSVAIAMYWRLLLQGEFGLVSYYLSQIGFPHAKGILSQSDSILVTMAFVDLWQWGPFLALVFMASMSSQSNAPKEAAFLDGASRVRTFFDVTLPSLFPTIALIAIIRGIDAFKEFDKVYILTGGGPGTASELASIYIWRMAFRQWDIGYAAALSLVLYLIIYVATAILKNRTARNVAR